MTTDGTQSDAVEDEVTHDFGDPEEACLSAAWSYIQTGVIDDKAGRKVLRRNKELNNPGVFIGVIETRKRMRKK